MNRKFLGLIAGLVFFAMAGAANAALIQGEVTFAGNWAAVDADGNATGIGSAEGIAFGAPTSVLAANGAFDGAAGTGAAFQDFTFAPFTDPVQPLWQFSVGGVTFSFDLTKVNVALQSSEQLNLVGSGIAYADGYEDTNFFWNFSGDTSGTLLTFSSASAAVPEPSVVGLLGLGLLAMGVMGLRRRQGNRAGMAA